MAKTNQKRLEELQALGRLVGDPGGRRWLWAMLSECHIWQTSMAGNALRLAFLEGERSQGLRLLGEIQEANPAMFIQMMTEMSGERRGGTNGNGSSIDDRDYNPLAGDDAGPGYDAE